VEGGNTGREIKFCVYSKEAEEMLFWEDLLEAPDLLEFLQHPNENEYYSRLLQFTGLIDDKRTVEYPDGQEIYDGDIVKWSSLNIDGEAIGEITLLGGCWFIQGEKHNGHLYDCLTCVVIGNTYKNKYQAT